MSLSTLPGEWVGWQGSSDDVAKTVDVGKNPHRCHVDKECCTDEFSVCYGTNGYGTNTNVVTVTRTDILGGWGQRDKHQAERFSEAPHHLTTGDITQHVPFWIISLQKISR